MISSAPFDILLYSSCFNLKELYLKGEEMPLGRMSSSNLEPHFDSGRFPAQYPETPAGVLQEIAMKCGTKVY